MKEAFCSNCGQERIGKVRFCGDCGHGFSIVKETAAQDEFIHTGYVKAIGIGNGEKGTGNRLGTWPNILINIIAAISLISLNLSLERQIEWGGGEDYINGVLVFIIIIQVSAVFLQRREKSISVLLPGIISFISIFPTLAMYKDYHEWIEYQGYNTQAMATGDLTLMGKCFTLFAVVAIANVVLLLIPANKMAANEKTKKDGPSKAINPIRYDSNQVQQAEKKSTKSANLFFNIVIGILLYNWGSAVQDYLDWGYGDTQVVFLFVLIAVLQIIVVLTERKHKSYYGAIPVVLAVVGCFPTLVYYTELQSLIDDQMYSSLVIPVADRVFIAFYFLLTAVLIATNFFLMHNRWNEIHGKKLKIELNG